MNCFFLSQKSKTEQFTPEKTVTRLTSKKKKFPKASFNSQCLD